MGAELTLDQQISFLDGMLMFEPKEQLVLNPFLGISNQALLLSIRKSLIELKTIKNGKVF